MRDLLFLAGGGEEYCERETEEVSEGCVIHFEFIIDHKKVLPAFLGTLSFLIKGKVVR